MSGLINIAPHSHMIGKALEITSWGVLQPASKHLLINLQQLPTNLAVIDVGEPRIVSMAEAYLLNKSVKRTAAAALIRRIDLSAYEGNLTSFLQRRCADCAKYEDRTSGFVQSDLVAMLSAPFTGPKVKVETIRSIKPKLTVKMLLLCRLHLFLQ